MMGKWEVKGKDGELYGPVDTETLIRWVKERRVLTDDLVSLVGEGDWRKAGEVPFIEELFSPSLPEKLKVNKEQIVKPRAKSTVIFTCPRCGYEGSRKEFARFGFWVWFGIIFWFLLCFPVGIAFAIYYSCKPCRCPNCRTRF